MPRQSTAYRPGDDKGDTSLLSGTAAGTLAERAARAAACDTLLKGLTSGSRPVSTQHTAVVMTCLGKFTRRGCLPHAAELVEVQHAAC